MTQAEWDATLALVRWQRTRRGYDNDANLLQAGLSLLRPDTRGQFGPQSALARAEQVFNMPWQRLASEVLQFAVFLVTKAKRDEQLRPRQTRQGLRLLQLALNVFAVRGDAQLTTLPLNSCNLLLVALAETLEKTKRDADTLQTLQDVNGVFLYLFGLPSEHTAATPANFQMYRPPTNVFADFLKHALTAAFQSLTELQKEEDELKTEKERLYVDVVHAALFVFQELQKTQTNKKKVFLAIAKTSLRDMVEYRYALVTLQKKGVAGVRAIISLLDRVVEDALFDVEHIRQFDGAMVHGAVWKQGGDSNSGAQEPLEDDSKAKKRRKGGKGAGAGLVSYQKNLFDEFLDFLSDSEVQPELKTSAGGFFEVLVRSFATRIRAAAHSKIEDTKTDLKTSRKRAAIVIATTSTTYSPFKFWSELCAVAYLAFKRQEKALCNSFLPVLVTVYNALFRALCECDVYRVTEDTEEREQFQTMEKVLSSFLELLNAERNGTVSVNASQASEACQIISSAVKCSPNLVNGCLVPIFELLGTQAVQAYSSQESDGNAQVVTAASSTVVELIRAYDSMRLLDGFLRAAFAVQQTPEGLYKLFALPLCESILRKALMTLPPGQMDVLWNLFVVQIASYSSTSDDDVRSANGLALVRLLFQTFVQEVHVVPQNRAKVVALVSHTHEKLLAPLAEQLTQTSVLFSPYERELFCVFGELLMFDSVLSASVREQTFDVVFGKLQGDRFGSVMEQLLVTKIGNSKKKRTSKREGDVVTGVTTSHGLGAAGIVKICVYWLRKARDDLVMIDEGKLSRTVEAPRAERERVARLVTEYVIQWKCWEAVSFHLPELMANASKYECDHFLREILDAFVKEAVCGNSEGAAGRIICDAGFYEIRSLREVACVSLTAMGAQYVDEVQNTAPDCMAKIVNFFSFLMNLPSSYLKPQECGDLLSVTLSLYKAISMPLDNAPERSQACSSLLAWVQLQFKAVGVEVHTSKNAQPGLGEQLRDGARFIISQLVVNEAVNVGLVAEVLGHYLDIDDTAFVKEILDNVMSMKKKKEPSKATQDLKRAVIVVEALALTGKRTPSASKVEKEFINSVVDVVIRENICKATDEPLPLEILNALLKYQSVLHVRAQRHKQQQKEESATKLLRVLVECAGSVLATSMKLVVASSDAAGDTELQQAAWSFFANFCQEYASFRKFVTPLETFGCLLAVALSLVTSDNYSSKLEMAELALHALIASANKEEFRLILATGLKELAASESSRKLSALRALCLLLGGERRLNASRRQVLNEHKEAIVVALLQNFTLLSLRVGAAQVDEASELSVWNMKAFVQVFCRAELFTWKTHELQHIFTGFQPLIAAVSCWQAGIKTYSSQQLHQLWTLSYTLLLRIVRNHFASLVNGIPHLIQAANALLQLVVLVSADDEASQHCSQWSSNLARLYGYMKEHDVQLRKHVVYLLMTFLVGVTRDKLAVRFQQKLRPGVFALLDVCSPYEKEQLYAALDSTGKSLLKTLDTNYKLTHRYVGKV